MYITYWTYQCSDGCCSDAGADVVCGQYQRDDIQLGYEDSIPVYIINDIISKILDSVDYSNYKEQFFKSVGERYDGSDWFWASHLKPLTDEKILKLFSDFGIPFDGIIRNEEER